MKRLLTFVFIIHISVSILPQTVYTDSQDGKLFFKIKDNVFPMMPVKSNAVDISQHFFMSEICKKYNILSIKKAFNLKAASLKLNKIYLVEFSDETQIDNIIRDIKNLNEIEYAERVPFNRISYVPNDPNYSLTEWGYNWNWYLDKIQAESAWDVSTGSSTIKIAVVDNAIWADHPDLTNKVVAEYNAMTQTTGNSNPPASVSQTGSMTSYEWSHGTHCAGLIGAQTDNNEGIASIGFNISIMAARCADDNGDLYYTTYGTQWAANNGANVISMSFGSSQYSSSMDQFYTDIKNSGIVLVSSAGNDGVSTYSYPAAYSAVIAVGSTNEDDHLSSFSQYGSWVDIAAPGGFSPNESSSNINILSTTYCESYYAGAVPSLTGEYYDGMQGTSMACPITAGLCGLMLSLNPGLTPDQVLNCLQSSADPLQGGNSISSSGGRINAFGAMQCVQSTLSVPPIADFTANTTTVVVGNTVTFTDASIGTVSSYSWNFPGGTPATTTGPGPHTVQYNTTGQYNASLTATNSYGSDTETKTNYIEVVDAGTGCDYLYNYGSTDSLTLYTFGSSAWGYWSGHNEYNFSKFAEHITNNVYTYIFGMYVAVGNAYAGNSPDIVTFKIYDSGTSPGTELATKDVQINTLTEYSWNYIEFDNPVAVGTDFYAGYEVFYNTPADTFSVFVNEARSNYNTAHVYYNSSWTEMGTLGLPTSYGIEVLACSDQIIAYFDVDTNQVCTGNPVVFTDYSLGNVTSYSWNFGVDATPATATTVGPHTVTYSSAGQKTISLTVSDGTNSDTYTSLITVYSASATISPATSTVCSGESEVLTASGGTTYNWSTGETTATIVVSPTTNTIYTVTVTSDICSDTDTATVSVTPAPTSGTASAASNMICENTTTTITLTGYSGNIQWQESPDGITLWTDVTGGSGGTTATYTTTSLSSTAYYRAKVSLGSCTDTYSNVVMIETQSAPAAGTAAVNNSSTCTGNTVNLTLSGYYGSIQWQSSPDGITWSDISGANTDNYTTGALSSDTYFQAVVSVSGCSDVISNNVMVTVTPGAVAGTATSSQTEVCYGDQPTLTLSGYTGTIQWQSSPDGTTWSNISGATSDNYTTDPITGTIYYQAIVSYSACPDVISNVITIQLVPDPVAGFSFINNDYDATFTNSSTNATSYLWQFGDGNTSTIENPVHTYGSTGTYTVTLIAVNVCGIADTTTQTIDIVTGINTSDLYKDFAVFPNPNNGVFVLNYPDNLYERFSIDVINQKGQIVKTIKIDPVSDKAHYKFDLGIYAKGVYHLKIHYQDKTVEKQVIIK